MDENLRRDGASDIFWKNYIQNVRFEVFTAVTMKNGVF
jgi:hypothetical protein